jgi:formamidopyrimidine-DNA glycosylase
MPELPEVETTRRAIVPHLKGRTITAVVLRTAKLRLPLAPSLIVQLTGQRVADLERRGKYLLFACTDGTLLLHLGMTGRLRLVPHGTAPGRFDHVELHFDNGLKLCFSDPRKFGTLLWLTVAPRSHPLLAGLGPEPLEACFTPEYLYRTSRGRKVPLKTFIMNSRVVSGIGNIYANEALFRARCNPAMPSADLTEAQAADLTDAIRQTLEDAITTGSATLGDFLDPAGSSGYFRVDWQVYGRGGEPCRACGCKLQQSRLGGRSTVWCPECQK